MKRFIITLVTIAVIAAASYACISYGLMYIFSDVYHIKISWAKIDKITPNGLVVRALTVSDKKTGFGFFAKRATIRLRWNDLISKGAVIDFELDGVNFRKRMVDTKSFMDNITGLVATPFTDKWSYKDMAGTVQPTKTGLVIRKFTAISDEIRINTTGVVNYDNTLDLAITIDFSDKTLTKIPVELTSVALEPKEDGWKSITVNLEGDYKSPSIQLSSKLFRLKINSISSR